MLCKTLEGLASGGGGPPAFISNEVGGEVDAGLDAQEEIERNLLQGILVGGEIFGIGWADRSCSRDPAVELFQLLSNDVRVNHVSPPQDDGGRSPASSPSRVGPSQPVGWRECATTRRHSVLAHRARCRPGAPR